MTSPSRALMILIPMALAAGAAWAERTSPWVEVAAIPGHKIEMNVDTVTFDKDASGSPTVSAVGRSHVYKDGDVLLTRWRVKASDCARGLGSLHVLSLGEQTLFVADFMFEGGNISSGVAEVLCGVSDFIRKKKKESGS